MKIKLVLFILALLTLRVRAQDASTAEQTQKMLDESARRRAIALAPPAHPEALQKVDRHKLLIAAYGGEENLKIVKEKIMLQGRGFTWLEHLCLSYRSMWQSYLSGMLIANKKAGMSSERQIQEEEKVLEEMKTYSQDNTSFRATLVKLAPSIQASELEKKAATLCAMYSTRQFADGKSHDFAAVRQQLLEASKEVNEILQNQKQLPELPALEVQKEYNAISEDNLPTPTHS